jgi:hypothetical protein
MPRSPHLYFDLLDLAAAIRADGSSARFVAVTAEAGRLHCAVTTGSDLAPDAAPDPFRARHPLHGAALQEAAAEFARELVTRRFGALQELGGKGLVTIDASGAVRLDLETRTGLTVHEPVCLDRLRRSAVSHPTHRAVCLAAALSDDARFPAWSQSEQAQRDWMRAASEIDPRAGPEQDGIDTASKRLVVAFRPVGLSSDSLREVIRERLYPDLASPVLAPGPVPDTPEGLGAAPAWLPLDPLEAERLHAALEGAADPVLTGVLAKLRSCLSDVSSDEAFRAAAVEKYAGRLNDGDLDFQPDGMVSKGDEGAYVQAFLWVTNAEAGFEEPEEDPAP